MASPERKISGVAPRGTPSVETRLAGLEAEAVRLRAEVAALQDEIRWLTGDDEADGDGGLRSTGWLARGWVRASMLMAVVALVAFVSVPYVLHLLDLPTQRADSPGPRAVAPGAASKATASEYIPAPMRVRSPEVPAPTYVHTRAGAPPRRENP